MGGHIGARWLKRTINDVTPLSANTSAGPAGCLFKEHLSVSQMLNEQFPHLKNYDEFT
jgi:hypothetical protein